MAARQGDEDSQRILGLMYYAGEGVPGDLIRAYFWLNIAAMKGDEKSIEKCVEFGREIANTN